MNPIRGFKSHREHSFLTARVLAATCVLPCSPAMRLSVFEHGRLSLVPLSSSRTYNVFEVNALIAKLFKERRQLSLDFSGEYVPICTTEEISIVSSHEIERGKEQK